MKDVFPVPTLPGFLRTRIFMPPPPPPPPRARPCANNEGTRLNLFHDPTEWGRDLSAEKWRPQRAIFYNQDDVFGGASGRCEGWTGGAARAPTSSSKYHLNTAYVNSKTQFGRPLLVADGCIDSKLITLLSLQAVAVGHSCVRVLSCSRARR